MRRFLALLLGWSCIVLGVIGLFLPVLQGILFLLIGLFVLSSEYAWACSILQKLRSRFPSLACRCDEAARRAHEALARLLGRQPGTVRRKGVPRESGPIVSPRSKLLGCRLDLARDGRNKLKPTGIAQQAVKVGGLDSEAPMSETKLMVALRDTEDVNDPLTLACHLKSAMKAELTALHVVEIGPGMPLDTDAEILDRAGSLILSLACDAAAQNSVPIATKLVRSHHTGRSIVREAIDQKIDLLIMGYYPGYELAEMLFGSTFRYVARHSPCRLLIENPSSIGQTLQRESGKG